MLRSVWLVAAIVTLIVVGVAVITWFLVFHGASVSNNPTDWGVFGDYFGGVLPTLIVMPGFCVLIYTLKLQCETLKAQGEALEVQLLSIKH